MDLKKLEMSVAKGIEEKLVIIIAGDTDITIYSLIMVLKFWTKRKICLPLALTEFFPELLCVLLLY